MAGARYDVEVSDDMKTWSREAGIYGLGNEFVVTMREYTPPPPPPPGTPPAVPQIPSVPASVQLRRASGPAVGTVVSWPSLDHGGPIVTNIDGEMVAGWDSIPLFALRCGDYDFFVWHPPVPQEAPSAAPLLGPKDTAMLAALEQGLPDMNQAVEDSVARARNAPPPAPPDPDGRRFWRIRCDWSIDTDLDGSLDWAEFEMAARGDGGLVTGVVGNPFDADTNRDGTPDGEQLDLDGDGRPDARDVGIDDKSASFEITRRPRYAVFPIDNAQPFPTWTAAIEINDLGTVLYNNGTWTGGKWQLLAGAAEQPTNTKKAARINDLAEIIGIETTGRVDQDGNPVPGNVLYASGPDKMLEPLVIGGAYPYHLGLLLGYPGSAGIQLSNGGCFLAEESYLDGSDIRSRGHFLWTLPGAGRNTGMAPVNVQNGGALDANLYWGWLVANPPVPGERVVIDGVETVTPCQIRNVHEISSGGIIVNFDYGVGTQVLDMTGWHPSETYGPSIDISSDGIAIAGHSLDGKIAPILLGGDWLGLERIAPGVAAGWGDPATGKLDATTELVDTTAGGYILARRGSPGARNHARHAAAPAAWQPHPQRHRGRWLASGGPRGRRC